MPDTYPATSERKRSPSSSPPVSPTDAVAGVAVSSQSEHGQIAGVAVENVHVRSVASWLPARSLMPPGPLSIVAVYVVDSASGALGRSVAVSVWASYETVAGTTAFAASRSTNVAAVTVAGTTCSGNVSLTSTAG